MSSLGCEPSCIVIFVVLFRDFGLDADDLHGDEDEESK